MKGLVLVIIIFLFCAVVGYQVAKEFGMAGPEPTIVPTETTSLGTQYRLILIHVDRLDRPQPRMVSVWFLSLFFVEGAPPTVTLAQMYPTPGNTAVQQSFEGSFSLTREGSPSPNFWKVVKTRHIEWEGYLMLDDFTVQNVGEWINGPGDFPGLLSATRNNPVESERVIKHTCEMFGELDKKEPAPFGINDLIPAHFRSNLSMEKALSYWNVVTNSKVPIKCDVVLAP